MRDATARVATAHVATATDRVTESTDLLLHHGRVDVQVPEVLQAVPVQLVFQVLLALLVAQDRLAASELQVSLVSPAFRARLAQEVLPAL